MDYCDDIPVGRNAYGWNPDGDEERELMEEAFEAIRIFDHERRTFHNRDGFFAELAYSEKCLALGHVEPEPPEGEEYYDPYVDDELYLDGTHDSGWGGETICLETRWGVACVTCESGDCPYLGVPGSIWEMKGVAA